MIGKLLCSLGLHDWVPVSWLTCKPNDTGHVCRRCYKEASE